MGIGTLRRYHAAPVVEAAVEKAATSDEAISAIEVEASPAPEVVTAPAADIEQPKPRSRKKR